MNSRRVLMQLSLLVVLTILSSAATSAQETHRISGKVVNGSNTGIARVTVFVYDAFDNREVGTGQTTNDGTYSVTFKTTATIKVYYGDFNNLIPNLSGRTNHQLTKVVANIVSGRNAEQSERVKFLEAHTSKGVPLSFGNNKND